MKRNTHLLALMGGCLILSTTSLAFVAPATFVASSTLLGVQEEKAPRYMVGVLENFVFGDSANVTLKTDEGNTVTVFVNSASKIMINNAVGTLTQAYQNLNKKRVKLLVEKESFGLRLVTLWDDASYLMHKKKHEGTQQATIKSISGRMLVLSDGRHYRIDDTSKFSRGGKMVGPKKMEGLTQAWVVGNVTGEFPSVAILGDTSASVNANVDTSNQPERPESNSNNQRPPSSGANTTKYRVRLELDVYNEEDLEKIPFLQELKDRIKFPDFKDGRIEPFGKIKFNNRVVWDVSEQAARSYQFGSKATFTFQPTEPTPGAIGEFIVTGPTLKITGTVWDDDLVGKSDKVFVFNKTIDLAQWAQASVAQYIRDDLEHAAVRCVVVKI